MKITEILYTSAFLLDIKKLRRKIIDDSSLAEVIDLIIENSDETINLLRSYHKMHTLKGKWKGSYVCNAGDWLLIWTSSENSLIFLRTGSHDDLFRQ